MKGATQPCLFEGCMDADFYVHILESTLLPFIRSNFPTSHRLMQDNDPKHCSKKAREFMMKNGVNWWVTPPESPDCNAIENLWHELKEYVRREVKPVRKEELVAGILKFWETVTPQKCARYIRHLKKVLPKVVEMEGDATGF